MKNLIVRADKNEVKRSWFYYCFRVQITCLSKVLFAIFTVCGAKYFFVESIVFSYHVFLQKKKKRDYLVLKYGFVIEISLRLSCVITLSLTTFVIVDLQLVFQVLP